MVTASINSTAEEHKDKSISINIDIVTFFTTKNILVIKSIWKLHWYVYQELSKHCDIKAVLTSCNHLILLFFFLNFVLIECVARLIYFEKMAENTFEQKLFNQTKKVPVVGFVHGLGRMIPYAASGNAQVCLESATGMLGNLGVTAASIAGLAAGGPVAAVATQATLATTWAGLETVDGVGKSINKKKNPKNN